MYSVHIADAERSNVSEEKEHRPLALDLKENIFIGQQWREMKGSDAEERKKSWRTEEGRATSTVKEGERRESQEQRGGTASLTMFLCLGLCDQVVLIL